MNGEQENTIRQVALVSEQRLLVKSLAGFRKTHQVPTDVNDRTQQFVGRIAGEDIGEDLDQRFTEFRRHFGFKRVDLRVNEPDGGMGAIATPWFEYRVTVMIAEDDASEAVFRRQVSDFHDPKALMSSEFATVFANVFNTIEFEPPVAIEMEEFIDTMEERDNDSMSIEFDRTATWCELTVPSIPGTLLVESDRVALVTNQPQLPARLLEAFLSFQEHLPTIA